MDINGTQVLTAVAIGAVGWFARTVVKLRDDYNKSWGTYSEWKVATDKRLDFIYERIRFTIATDIKSNPKPEDEILDRLTQRFIEKTISHSELKELIDKLEMRKRLHPIKKEQDKAENFLELIRYEYQLGTPA